MYLSAMRYPVLFFLPTAFICICFNYVVLLERTNKDIIYIAITGCLKPTNVEDLYLLAGIATT